ncbi:insulinase family protein [Pseudomonas sp. 21LCFQ02]|uniref:M16 family metallopeptidase n=1 Tax=Pseudomonas sp. 21LCFQ02 TaxID=2957505 RepID=UPI00209A98D2|nr:pitrilysin family protein [Pseudomonas sp. 21LCFQ02]MCO8166939.1 insulinase family protein [Pseudomonas sp. 21LCFQ02]
MRCLLLIWLLLCSLPSLALDRLQAQGYLLPNGLQVLLKPAYDKGHVAIRLIVGVGFDDFACEHKELPHLLEHLMFSGIDDSGEGGLESRMQALGGEWNAFTSNADTTFVIEAPARNQRKVLDLLMQVLTHTELTQSRLDTVRRIVAHEDGGHASRLQRLLDRRDAGSNASSQVASELGLKCADSPDVEAVSLEQLEDALAAWYAPNNMTLIMVGDLDKLLPGYLERVYGRLAATEPAEHPTLDSAKQVAEQRRVLTRGVLGESARLHLIFPEPLLDEQHDETWELVRSYLEWSLYSELRLQQGLSYGPSVSREVFSDTGLMSLDADVERSDLLQAEQTLHALLERLQRDGLQAATFERLKQAAVARQAWAVQGNSALADYYWGALNDYENGRFADPAKRIQAVTLEGANRALRQLLEQPGYIRIEKPLFSYDDLYWLVLAAGVLMILLLVGGLRYRRQQRL